MKFNHRANILHGNVLLWSYHLRINAMSNETLSSTETSKQELIDAIALDLKVNQGINTGESAEELADLLDLCPEQDVWIYEPNPIDPESDTVFATFRLQDTYGTIFHISCEMTDVGEVL